MKLYNYLRSYFPRRLPVGLTAFHEWSDRIIGLTGPVADTDSLKWVLANMIMHMKPTEAYVADQHFVRGLLKGAANQVAGQVFLDIKEKQAAATALAQSEATTLKVASSDVQKAE